MENLADKEILAYTRFRDANLGITREWVAQNIQTAQAQILAAEQTVSRLYAEISIQEQSLLSAWTNCLSSDHQGFDSLFQQLWFLNCKVLDDRISLQVDAQAERGKRIQLWLNLLAKQKVEVHQPKTKMTPILQSALDLLLIDSRLVDLVVLSASACGWKLAVNPGQARQNQIDRKEKDAVDRIFRAQRSEWLSKERSNDKNIRYKLEMSRQLLDDLYEQVSIFNQQFQTIPSHQDRSQRFRRYQEEWSNLRASPSVKGITIQKDIVHLLLKDIICDGCSVGEFEILMNFEKGVVSITNLTQPIYDGGQRYDHPHVLNTVPCFGNIGEQVHNLLGTRNIFHLSGLLIEYLQSYNSSSCYRSIEYWRGTVSCSDSDYDSYYD